MFAYMSKAARGEISLTQQAHNRRMSETGKATPLVIQDGWVEVAHFFHKNCGKNGVPRYTYHPDDM
jgi:hypothetical protein